MQSDGHFHKLFLESVDILGSASNQMFMQLYLSYEQFRMSVNMWAWALRSTGRLTVKLQQAVEGPGPVFVPDGSDFKRL